jgi:hypothetical protein
VILGLSWFGNLHMKNRSLHLMALVMALLALLLAASENPRFIAMAFLPVLVSHLILGAVLDRMAMPGWRAAMVGLLITAGMWNVRLFVNLELNLDTVAIYWVVTILALVFALWKSVPMRSSAAPAWLTWTCLVLVWLYFTFMGGFFLLTNYYPKA